VERIKKGSGSDLVELGQMDLSNLESIRAFAEAYVRSGRPLHVLILNAGVMPMFPQARSTTRDGFELYVTLTTPPQRLAHIHTTLCQADALEPTMLATLCSPSSCCPR